MMALKGEDIERAADLADHLQRAMEYGAVPDIRKLMIELDMDMLWILTQMGGGV